jgi:hypothetical protein
VTSALRSERRGASGSRARFADYAEAAAGASGRGPAAARARRRPRRPAPHTRNLFISSYVKFTRNTRYCILLMLRPLHVIRTDLLNIHRDAFYSIRLYEYKRYRPSDKKSYMIRYISGMYTKH